jgi:hypothetical protein
VSLQVRRRLRLPGSLAYLARRCISMRRSGRPQGTFPISGRVGHGGYRAWQRVGEVTGRRLEINTLSELVSEAISDFAKVVALAHAEVPADRIAVEILAKPHKALRTLPTGHMAVYAFFLNGQALKVGKVGPKSAARYRVRCVVRLGATSSRVSKWRIRQRVVVSQFVARRTVPCSIHHSTRSPGCQPIARVTSAGIVIEPSALTVVEKRGMARCYQLAELTASARTHSSAATTVAPDYSQLRAPALGRSR